MAIYYGHYGKDTEGTRGSAACQAKVENCQAKAAEFGETEPYHCEKKGDLLWLAPARPNARMSACVCVCMCMCTYACADVCNERYIRDQVFTPLFAINDGLVVVGGGGLHQPQGFDSCKGDEKHLGKKLSNLMPEEVIRVMILPSDYCHGPTCEFPGGGERVHHDAEKRQVCDLEPLQLNICTHIHTSHAIPCGAGCLYCNVVVWMPRSLRCRDHQRRL